MLEKNKIDLLRRKFFGLISRMKLIKIINRKKKQFYFKEFLRKRHLKCDYVVIFTKRCGISKRNAGERRRRTNCVGRKINSAAAAARL